MLRFLTPRSQATADFALHMCNQGTGLSACYIARMMPSPVTYWLQQIIIVIALLAAILLLILFPARHVLLILWPWPVEEQVMVTEEQGAGRRDFVPILSPRVDDGVLVARDRPFSLLAIERPNQPLLFAFLVGLRDEPGATLAGQLPASLRPPLVQAPLEAGILVVMLADEDHRELPTEDVVRLYRPNQLGLTDRSAILLRRLAAAWRAGRIPSGLSPSD
jgi:ABC-type phosphate transport system auxiliary subunit